MKTGAEKVLSDPEFDRILDAERKERTTQAAIFILTGKLPDGMRLPVDNANIPMALAVAQRNRQEN